MVYARTVEELGQLIAVLDAELVSRRAEVADQLVAASIHEECLAELLLLVTQDRLAEARLVMAVALRKQADC